MELTASDLYTFPADKSRKKQFFNIRICVVKWRESQELPGRQAVHLPSGTDSCSTKTADILCQYLKFELVPKEKKGEK
jgi:hypothetical protein